VNILGVGLSRTGTKSLARALQILGYRTLHNDRERLNPIILGEDVTPDFRVYDDVDAVTDLPSAYFFRELLQAYPEAKAILTERDTNSWLRSYRSHVVAQGPPETKNFLNKLLLLLGRPKQVKQHELFRYKIAMRNLVYGSVEFRELLNRDKFERHNAAVKQEVPAQRLLVMNIIDGDGWEKLCAYLGVDAPSIEFPTIR